MKLWFSPLLVCLCFYFVSCNLFFIDTQTLVLSILSNWQKRAERSDEKPCSQKI